MFPHNPNAWPADRVTELRMLVADGLSASRIAAKLGVFRNTVVGQLHRERARGYDFRLKPKKSGPPSNGQSKPRPTNKKPPTFGFIVPDHVEPLRVPLLKLQFAQCCCVLDERGAD